MDHRKLEDQGQVQQRLKNGKKQVYQAYKDFALQSYRIPRSRLKEVQSHKGLDNDALFYLLMLNDPSWNKASPFPGQPEILQYFKEKGVHFESEKLPKRVSVLPRRRIIANIGNKFDIHQTSALQLSLITSSLFKRFQDKAKHPGEKDLRREDYIDSLLKTKSDDFENQVVKLYILKEYFAKLPSSDNRGKTYEDSIADCVRNLLMNHSEKLRSDDGVIKLLKELKELPTIGKNVTLLRELRELRELSKIDLDDVQMEDPSVQAKSKFYSLFKEWAKYHIPHAGNDQEHCSTNTQEYRDLRRDTFSSFLAAPHSRDLVPMIYTLHNDLGREITSTQSQNLKQRLVTLFGEKFSVRTRRCTLYLIKSWLSKRFEDQKQNPEPKYVTMESYVNHILQSPKNLEHQLVRFYVLASICMKHNIKADCEKQEDRTHHPHLITCIKGLLKDHLEDFQSDRGVKRMTEKLIRQQIITKEDLELKELPTIDQNDMLLDGSSDGELDDSPMGDPGFQADSEFYSLFKEWAKYHIPHAGNDQERYSTNTQEYHDLRRDTFFSFLEAQNSRALLPIMRKLSYDLGREITSTQYQNLKQRLVTLFGQEFSVRTRRCTLYLIKSWLSERFEDQKQNPGPKYVTMESYVNHILQSPKNLEHQLVRFYVLASICMKHNIKADCEKQDDRTHHPHLITCIKGLLKDHLEDFQSDRGVKRMLRKLIRQQIITKEDLRGYGAFQQTDTQTTEPVTSDPSGEQLTAATETVSDDINNDQRGTSCSMTADTVYYPFNPPYQMGGTIHFLRDSGESMIPDTQSHNALTSRSFHAYVGPVAGDRYIPAVFAADPLDVYSGPVAGGHHDFDASHAHSRFNVQGKIHQSQETELVPGAKRPHPNSGSGVNSYDFASSYRPPAYRNPLIASNHDSFQERTLWTDNGLPTDLHHAQAGEVHLQEPHDNIVDNEGGSHDMRAETRPFTTTSVNRSDTKLFRPWD